MPFVPKIQGCHECSKRRIRCDRAKPSCQKCAKKGIPCSGFGIRHRFSNGVASRGRWAGKTMQAIFRADERDICLSLQSSSSSVVGTQTFTTPPPLPDPPTRPHSCQSDVKSVPYITSHEPPMAMCKASTSYDQFFTHNMEDSWLGNLPLEPAGIFDNLGSEAEPPLSILQAEMLNNTYDQDPPVEFDLGATLIDSLSPERDLVHLSLEEPEYYAAPNPSLSPDGLDPTNEFLLLYFSRHIAREMMIIDGPHNGWRHLILPIARSDELVRHSVLAASCFHLLLNSNQSTAAGGSLNSMPSWKIPGFNPQQFYTRAINGLLSRQLDTCQQPAHQSTLITIMVLLTSTMITGNQDFPILLRMLQSAFHALGGVEGMGQGELASFIVRQAHKLFVYAAPLISENDGLETMLSPVRMMQVFECLNYCAQQQPAYESVVSKATSLLYQAREIYLNQIPCTESGFRNSAISERSISRVESFIHTLQEFPQNLAGDHVLIWCSFIAACDCILEVHKQFFEAYFIRQNARNGFMNLIKGTECLRRIWTQGRPQRWASLLPQEKLFIM